MSVEYIDKTGLSYLWSKIKSTFAQKTARAITLTTSGWNLSGDIYVQTVSVPGVTANSILIVSSTPGTSDVYGECGVKCMSQASGTLTFNADTVPGSALTVNIVNLGEE